MKIAPTLQKFAKNEWWDSLACKEAAAELRALLAVAREAEKFANHWDHYGPKWRPLQRAVDRLKRASTPKASKP